MALAGVLLGLLGIAAAIYIPLKIEALKRPKLRIEWAADANNLGMFGGPTRIAHIAVINEPIEGWLGKWLLRNPATGCQVMSRLSQANRPLLVNTEACLCMNCLGRSNHRRGIKPPDPLD